MRKIRFSEILSPCDERNAALEVNDVIGMSIEKRFQKTKANLENTSLHNYKIVRKGYFVGNLIQVSRDRKIPIARYERDFPAIISPAYSVFTVRENSPILSTFFLMWVWRESFDKEAFLNAIGGIRGSLDWEDFLAFEIPLLPEDQQLSLISNFEAVTETMRLNREENIVLEEVKSILLDELNNIS